MFYNSKTKSINSTLTNSSAISDRKHNFHSPVFWLAIICLFFELLGLITGILNVSLPQFANESIFAAIGAKLWFGYFHYFTTLTNLILFCYLVLFLFLFKTRIFNNRNFATAVALYINMVMIAYWIVMSPQWFSGKYFDNYSWAAVVESISYHLIAPILFDVIYCIGVNYPYKNSDSSNPKNWIDKSKIWKYLFIYLLVYSAYIVAINFISLPVSWFRNDLQSLAYQHSYVSVYGWITNFNFKCYNLHFVNGIIQFNTESTGSLVYLCVSLAMLALTILIYEAVIYFNNQHIVPDFPQNKNKNILDLKKKKLLKHNIVSVDKPLWWTSNDVVQYLKKYFKFNKVGHAGTLDPLASGVLVLGINEGTKKLKNLIINDKSYFVKIKLGILTSSYDLGTPIIKKKSVPNTTAINIKKIITKNFIKTDYYQFPPKYSAKKVNGKHLYKYAINNEKVKIKPSKVIIKKCNVLSYNKKDKIVSIIINVSKGFYIRSFAYDLGKKLKTFGTVIELRRIKSGKYKLKNCYKLIKKEAK